MNPFPALRRFAIALALCASASAASERIALIIGQNLGLARDPRLLYAVEDARRFHGVLTELGGVSPERAYLLLNRGTEEVERTLLEIRGRIKELKLAGGTVELLVFYSGHADRENLHLEGRLWPLDSLRGFLEGCGADLKITILDACNSGAFITRKGGRLVEPYAFLEAAEPDARGAVVLTSSSAGEFSVESKALRGSLFSHHLLSGLRGAADYNRDHEVSLWEAYHFARVRTARQLGGGEYRQSPHFDFQVAGGRDLILTRLERGRSVVRFRNCPAGTYAVYNRDLSQQWAEVDVGTRDTVELRLPRDEYQVQRVDGGSLFTAQADLRYQPDWTLGESSFRRFALRDWRAKGMDLSRTVLETGLRVRMLSQFPEHHTLLPVPEASLGLRRGTTRAALLAGRLQSETFGEEVRIRRTGFGVGISLGWETWLARRVSVLPEIRYMQYRWTEAYERPFEKVIRGMGYGAMPDHEALAHGAGADFRLRAFAWRGIYAEVSLGMEGFLYGNQAGDPVVEAQYPLGLGIGLSLF